MKERLDVARVNVQRLIIGTEVAWLFWDDAINMHLY